MTVQDTEGTVFDSIVYAEKKPKHWLAGSDRFSRTKDFNAVDDSITSGEAVHLVVTYSIDGSIRCFRNGEPYGKKYVSKGPVRFEKEKSQILFGLRHGTGIGGNRMLKGRILEARLYNRALTTPEIKAAASGNGNFISNADVFSALGEKGNVQIKQWDEEIDSFKKQLETIGPPLDEREVWENLAHSIFNLKEFIYVY